MQEERIFYLDLLSIKNFMIEHYDIDMYRNYSNELFEEIEAGLKRVNNDFVHVKPQRKSINKPKAKNELDLLVAIGVSIYSQFGSIPNKEVIVEIVRLSISKALKIFSKYTQLPEQRDTPPINIVSSKKENVVSINSDEALKEILKNPDGFVKILKASKK